MPRSSDRSISSSPALWLVLGTLVVLGGLLAATQLIPGDSENLELAASRNARTKACQSQSSANTLATKPNGARWTSADSYVDKWGSTQHVGDGQTAACTTAATVVVPAQAQAEVNRNLALLQTQISEANARLARQAQNPEGGANFVQNAILGPLKDKRVATIERIVIAIDRVAERPQGLDRLAACTLNGRAGQVQTVNCPDVAAKLTGNGTNTNAGGFPRPGQGQNGGQAGGGQNNGGQAGGGQAGGGQAGGGQNGGGQAPALETLGADCSNSNLQPHNGFQDGDRCVETSMGEVASEEDNPSLLITRAPQQVNRNQAFTISVSTRNLVRDRFLAAAQGGYYLESGRLNGEGITRGHFHTACRMLQSTQVAPDPAPAPAFFVATEDGGGSAQPDTVNVQVTGLPQAGLAQCSVWAGDGSHRLPMMQRANQTPAFDVVRVLVR